MGGGRRRLPPPRCSDRSEDHPTCARHQHPLLRRVRTAGTHHASRVSQRLHPAPPPSPHGPRVTYLTGRLMHTIHDRDRDTYTTQSRSVRRAGSETLCSMALLCIRTIRTIRHREPTGSVIADLGRGTVQRAPGTGWFDPCAPPFLSLCQELQSCMGDCMQFRANAAQTACLRFVMPPLIPSDHC